MYKEEYWSRIFIRGKIVWLEMLLLFFKFFEVVGFGI